MRQVLRLLRLRVSSATSANENCWETVPPDGNILVYPASLRRGIPAAASHTEPHARLCWTTPRQNPIRGVVVPAGTITLTGQSGPGCGRAANPLLNDQLALRCAPVPA